MTRVMADSVTVADLPPGLPMYAGYANGRYANMNALEKRFPNAVLLSISVTASADIGDVLDVESGDATPAQAPGWVTMRRKAGVNPIVYCSTSVWPSVEAAFVAADVTIPMFWVAAYPGGGATIPLGAIGHQWIDHGGWDESVMASYIPGIDPLPVPPVIPPVSTPIIEVDMNLQETLITETSDGNGDGWYLLNAPAQNVLAITGNGPYPPDNGYWPSPVFSKQERGAETVISWTGAGKNGVISFFVQVAQ